MCSIICIFLHLVAYLSSYHEKAIKALQRACLAGTLIHAKCWGVQCRGERTCLCREARNSQTVSTTGGKAPQPPIVNLYANKALLLSKMVKYIFNFENFSIDFLAILTLQPRVSEKLGVGEGLQGLTFFVYGPM